MESRQLIEDRIRSLKGCIREIDQVLAVVKKPKQGKFRLKILEIVKAAGHHGVTVDEVVERAALDGMTIKRTTAAQQMSGYRTAGDFHLANGRYRFVEQRSDGR